MQLEKDSTEIFNVFKKLNPDFGKSLLPKTGVRLAGAMSYDELRKLHKEGKAD